MVVGVLKLSLVIGGARSLKDKRQVVRKVLDRARARFNVSAAEVGELEVWQRATLGFAAVANEAGFVNEVLDKITRDVEGSSEAQLVDRQLEIEHYEGMGESVRPGYETGDKPNLDWDDEATLTDVRGVDTDDERTNPGGEKTNPGREHEKWLEPDDVEKSDPGGRT